MILGLCWLAPCIEIWYSKLLPAITARYFMNMSNTKRIFCRLLVDTVVYAPFSYTGFYLIRDVAMKPGRKIEDVKAEVKEKFISTLMADWAIWTPVNLLNFWVVPVHWQGLYVGIFSFFFNVILSYISNKELKSSQKN